MFLEVFFGSVFGSVFGSCRINRKWLFLSNLIFVYQAGGAAEEKQASTPLALDFTRLGIANLSLPIFKPLCLNARFESLKFDLFVILEFLKFDLFVIFQIFEI